MPEIRRDPVSGRWTIIASTRNERPSDFASGKISESEKNCPFCPGNEEQTPPEICRVKSQKENNWELRVVPNKYPALVPSTLPNNGAIRRHDSGEWNDESAESEGLYRKIEGIGVHEVIIETPDHFRQMHEMDESDIAEVFKCFASRIREIKKDKKIKYIMIFKNYGRYAGASLAHPHSQLIAMPMVPMRVANELDGANAYFSQKSSCVFCDMIKQEISCKKRIVAENDFFIAINPYASRFS
ncbi:MAG: DUF4931 domain-containing protein, partial [Elusimicrobia bacterium]|nr:DUF4931 domain-containing protein [Elusimicrobiota bacterium]